MMDFPKQSACMGFLLTAWVIVLAGLLCSVRVCKGDDDSPEIQGGSSEELEGNGAPVTGSSPGDLITAGAVCARLSGKKVKVYCSPCSVDMVDPKSIKEILLLSKKKCQDRLDRCKFPKPEVTAIEPETIDTERHVCGRTEIDGFVMFKWFCNYCSVEKNGPAVVVSRTKCIDRPTNQQQCIGIPPPEEPTTTEAPTTPEPPARTSFQRLDTLCLPKSLGSYDCTPPEAPPALPKTVPSILTPFNRKHN